MKRKRTKLIFERGVWDATPRTKIERDWQLFGSVIPADSFGAGRQRTSYFYRLQAIAWARIAREYGWFDGGRMRDTAISIAKSYLKTFRQMQGANA